MTPPSITVEGAKFSLEDLLSSYDFFNGNLEYDEDKFDANRKLAALYRFAITHMDSPGNELLFEALAVVEQTWKDEN